MAANAHRFIVDDLAEGYETPVGEHGAKLSGVASGSVSPLPAILEGSAHPHPR
jgi:hypothetical protein